MPANKDIKSVLVIGSGPIVIGQAAEFDYAGSQACLSLREEGIKVTLINSNPATIQTDRSIADRVYIEPMTVEAIESIIIRENIDSILPSMGGQTALNLTLELHDRGILSFHGVRVLGTSVDSIRLAEDRGKFSQFISRIGEPVSPSIEISRKEFRNSSFTDYVPGIVRTSFTLGGSGGRMIRSENDLSSFLNEFFASTPEGVVELEKSMQGMKELEYEMIRDNNGNCICVCNMENLDPMGVHTGESIVVTPSQTLSDEEYQKLRTAAIHVVSSLGIVGSCNIQFALDQKTGDYFVVEVNPRTSRSSALASKASGYPIARIASKIAIGYNLNEIRNPITKNTFAAYEPSLDYVTVKIPRWPFDKFSLERTTGVQMKSVGEVMGIGRTFEEALMKAIASLDTQESTRLRTYAKGEELKQMLYRSSDLRIYAIFEALFQDIDPYEIAELTGYDPYFIFKTRNIVQKLKTIRTGTVPDNLHELKEIGISDSLISAYSMVPEIRIIEQRISSNILPDFKAVDTCSGEFEAVTPYMYSTYETEDEISTSSGDRKSVLVIGSGPNRIAQGLEFDYIAVKAVFALKKMGYRAIMLNSNPETVSTDFDISDALYFEPVTLEHVSNVIIRESVYKVIIQVSGQTGQNIALGLARIFGDEIIAGTKAGSIERIEDRVSFSNQIQKMSIRQPPFVYVRNEEELEVKLKEIGLPVIMRTSFVIGGRSMDIIYDMATARKRFQEIMINRPGRDVLVSRYIENSQEIDVDFISLKDKQIIVGLMVHIEEAGTHSGDATMILSGKNIEDEVMMQIREVVKKLSVTFDLLGFSNLQIAVKNNEIYVIELNSRASRTVPFISKATGREWVETAVMAMFDQPVNVEEADVRGFFIKVPVFPFKKFPEEEPLLGPEMKSTGEMMMAGRTYEEAIAKVANYMGISNIKAAILTIKDDDKDIGSEIAGFLAGRGVTLYATPGTSAYLVGKGISNFTIYRMEDAREPRIDTIIKERIPQIVINTPTMISTDQKNGNEMRKLCIKYGIPLITNARLAYELLIHGSGSTAISYREISEYQSI
jgi:carbamoyl-phosphate synthase large subunit